MAMKKLSAFRRSSITHKSFVFTVEGNPSTGWETDINPRKKRKADSPQDGFFKRRLRTNTLSPNHTKTKEKVRSRLLLKNGQYNILGKNIPNRRMRFFTDFWNTLIDLNWIYVLILFLLSLLLSWLFFAVIFYAIALIHGDLGVTNLPDIAKCFINFEGFTSAFLYSVETMHTIGYGYRYSTDQCAEAIIFMCLSALVGCALEAFIVGVVFVKFQMPAQRAQTLLFSTNAVVCTRDGLLCLLFRIGNMRKSLIIQLAVRAHLVHHRLTEEGELMPFHQHEIFCKLDSMSGNAFSSWPVTACHVITPDSPLYDLTKASLGRSKFEIIVTLEGVVENTGSVLQARTSYIPSEIIWGHSFTRILTFRKEKGEYVVDFNHFQTLEPIIGMVGCSARELEENKSMSAPEIVIYDAGDGDKDESVKLSVTPGRHRSFSMHVIDEEKNLAGQEELACGNARVRSVSRLTVNNIADILKPPSPSLAHAVSSHTFESMQAMTKEYEHNMRRLSRVSIDMGAHQPIHRRASHTSSTGTDQLHRSSSPSPARRLGTVNFGIEPIEEDEKEITKF